MREGMTPLKKHQISPANNKSSKTFVARIAEEITIVTLVDVTVEHIFLIVDIDEDIEGILGFDFLQAKNCTWTWV